MKRRILILLLLAIPITSYAYWHDEYPAETSADDADKVMIYDNSATTTKVMTRANFLSGISGASNWLELSDTPSSFTANNWVKVNSAGDALEFVAAPSGSGDMLSTNNLSDVADIPTARANILSATNPSSTSVYQYNGTGFEWAASLDLDFILGAGINTAGSLGRATDTLTMRNNANTATLMFADDSKIATVSTIDAIGFDGNLTTDDDTIQEVAQKLDDLSTGSVTKYEGTVSLGTAAIASEACATVVQATVSNHLASDSFSWVFQGDVTGVTGYVPSTDGVLTIYAYSTAGYLNWKVCNMTAASITPGAVTINWQVIQ